MAGLLAIVWPGRTLLVVAIVFGFQLIVDGIYRLLAAFEAPGEAGGIRILIALLGILSIMVGLWAVRHLLLTLLSLTLFLGVYWIVHGVIVAFDAIAHRSTPARGAQILAGILGAIAGIIVVSTPGTSLATLAIVLGFWLLIYGAAQLGIAFQLRQTARRGEATGSPAAA